MFDFFKSQFEKLAASVSRAAETAPHVSHETGRMPNRAESAASDQSDSHKAARSLEAKDSGLETMIRKQNALEKIVSKYSDVIGRDAAKLRLDCEIRPVDELREHFARLFEADRLLQIGVIGRVKAGKSSLLNAVFFDGEDILPKAATPMTASLTTLRSGDSRAVVDFFSAEDIRKIRDASQEYQKLLDQACQLEMENRQASNKRSPEDLKALCKREAKKSINKSLEAANQQYEWMEKSGLLGDFEKGREKVEIDASDPRDLSRKLLDYVGSSGKLMPFTKSVELFLPGEKLENIAVIDTPGLNDPVSSRSERTMAYLDNCDAVFLVSPAGQFLSQEDLLLMSNLIGKRGVRELYAIASQSDNQLHGEDVVSEGSLEQAMDHVKRELGEMMRDSLECFGSRDGNIFGQLLEDENRLIFSSGICHALARRYKERNAWDSSMSHVFAMLEEDFPDYFDSDAAALASLEKLGGINAIQEALASIRIKKDEILTQRQKDALGAARKKVDDYALGLLEATSRKISVLEEDDIASLEKKRKELLKLKDVASAQINGVFEDCAGEFIDNLRAAMSKMQRDSFSEIEGKIAGAQGTRQEHHTETTKTGIIFTREITSHYTVEIETLDCGKINNDLNKFVINLEDGLAELATREKNRWRANLQQQIAHCAGQLNLADVIEMPLLVEAMRRQIRSLQLPEFDFSKYRFSSRGTGMLEGDAKTAFKEQVDSYLVESLDNFRLQIKNYISRIDKALKKMSLAADLFDELDEEARQLAELFQNKQENLSRLTACKQELSEAENA